MDAPAGPQVALIELSQSLEGVELATVRVAGEIGELAELAKHGPVDRGSQCCLHLMHRRDSPAAEQGEKRGGLKLGRAHNVRYRPL